MYTYYLHFLLYCNHLLIFTTLQANNLVIWSALEYYNQWQNNSGNSLRKPHVITCNVEHDAVLLPLKQWESKQQAVVDYLPVSENGCIKCSDILKAIKPNTCLISIMLANNETGAIMPVETVAKSLREINMQRGREGLCQIFFHTDAAQAIGKIPVDVNELGVDYLTIVGHKVNHLISYMKSTSNIWMFYSSMAHESVHCT